MARKAPQQLQHHARKAADKDNQGDFVAVHTAREEGFFLFLHIDGRVRRRIDAIPLSVEGLRHIRGTRGQLIYGGGCDFVCRRQVLFRLLETCNLRLHLFFQCLGNLCIALRQFRNTGVLNHLALPTRLIECVLTQLLQFCLLARGVIFLCHELPPVLLLRLSFSPAG